MSWVNLKRGAQKVFRKARGKVIKRYFKKGYKPKMGQIYKDIKYLKEQVNSEKKRIVFKNTTTATQTAFDNIVGQSNVNNNGYIVLDITPKPTQGPAVADRNGSSIKLHSSYLEFFIQSMTANELAIKMDYYIVLIKGQPVSNLTAFMSNMFQTNPWLTNASLIDTASNLNPDYFGTYQILKKGKFYLKDSETGTVTQRRMITRDFGMKYFKGKGHHIRFNQNSQTVLDGQLIFIVLADNGNVNPSGLSTISPANAESLTAQTGALIDFSITHYFYDN